LLLTFSETKSGFYFPVINETGKMTGIVSMSDVKSIIHRESHERSAQTVGAICQRDIIMLTPDDTLYHALQLFDIKGIEEIPVVESLENRWVLGMLKRRSVISAYNREVLKRGISEKVGSIRVSDPA